MNYWYGDIIEYGREEIDEMFEDLYEGLGEDSILFVSDLIEKMIERLKEMKQDIIHRLREELAGNGDYDD